MGGRFTCAARDPHTMPGHGKSPTHPSLFSFARRVRVSCADWTRPVMDVFLRFSRSLFARHAVLFSFERSESARVRIFPLATGAHSVSRAHTFADGMTRVTALTQCPPTTRNWPLASTVNNTPHLAASFCGPSDAGRSVVNIREY